MKLHEKIFQALRRYPGITSIRLSMNEFRQILNDVDARDRYSDGTIYGITLVVGGEDAWGD